MKKKTKFVFGLVTVAILGSAQAGGVKYIDGSAVTCSNGDKSGVISTHSGGQVCITGNNAVTKCSSSWSKKSAASYYCEHSESKKLSEKLPETGRLRKDSMLFSNQVEIEDALAGEGVWDIEKAFSPMVTTKEIKVKIIKMIDLEGKGLVTIDNGERVTHYYTDDILVIGDQSGKKYYARYSDVILK